MTHRRINVRSGLTAIAAVLALSFTPLLAQETTSPPDPVTETPSEPAPAADPLAPETTASEPVASEAAATDEAAPAAAPTRQAAARSKTVARDRAPSEPARSSAPVPAQQPTEATAEAMPVPPPPAAAPVTDPYASAEPVAVEEPVADEALPIAGAVGLGLLALGGVGLALQGRRRRREERAHRLANQRYLEEHPEEPTTSHDVPAFVRASQPAMPMAASAASAAPAAAVRTDVPRTTLPEGFDLSRFGPHVRAAYLGPTPENPSLSLQYRLRRAAAMDQRERVSPSAAPKPAAPAPRPATPQWRSGNGSFMLRRAGTEAERRRPAFQK